MNSTSILEVQEITKKEIKKNLEEHIVHKSRLIRGIDILLLHENSTKVKERACDLQQIFNHSPRTFTSFNMKNFSGKKRDREVADKLLGSVHVVIIDATDYSQDLWEMLILARQYSRHVLVLIPDKKKGSVRIWEQQYKRVVNLCSMKNIAAFSELFVFSHVSKIIGKIDFFLTHVEQNRMFPTK